jgi:hypothetical protein
MNATNIIIYLNKYFLEFYFLVKIKVLHVTSKQLSAERLKLITKLSQEVIRETKLKNKLMILA